MRCQCVRHGLFGWIDAWLPRLFQDAVFPHHQLERQFMRVALSSLVAGEDVCARVWGEVGSVRDRGGGGRRILLVLNINHCTVSSEEEDTHWQEVNQSHNAMHTEGSPPPLTRTSPLLKSEHLGERSDFLVAGLLPWAPFLPAGGWLLTRSFHL